MNKELSPPALIAAVLAAVILVISIGWYVMNRDNGKVAAYAGEHGMLRSAGTGGGSAALPGASGNTIHSGPRQ